MDIFQNRLDPPPIGYFRLLWISDLLEKCWPPLSDQFQTFFVSSSPPHFGYCTEIFPFLSYGASPKSMEAWKSFYLIYVFDTFKCLQSPNSLTYKLINLLRLWMVFEFVVAIEIDALIKGLEVYVFFDFLKIHVFTNL